MSRALSSHRLLAGDGDNDSAEAFYECNICLDTAKEPVVTMCGHLFCWPCLYRWIVGNTSCPVCKDHIDQNRLIPIYCRQQPSTASPADSASCRNAAPIPPRPAGLRLLMPEPGAGVTGTRGNGGGNVGATMGGTLTLDTSLRELQNELALRLPMARGRAGRAWVGVRHLDGLLGRFLNTRQQEFLTRALLVLGSFVIVCLLLF